MLKKGNNIKGILEKDGISQPTPKPFHPTPFLSAFSTMWQLSLLLQCSYSTKEPFLLAFSLQWVFFPFSSIPLLLLFSNIRNPRTSIQPTTPQPDFHFTNINMCYGSIVILWRFNKIVWLNNKLSLSVISWYLWAELQLRLRAF